MRVCILFGSLRGSSNTALLLEPFMEELREFGADVEHITLRDKHIEPCTACWTCQDIFEGPGCPKEDDMEEIYEAVLRADFIIFATPIYSWYCTPPMKAVMERLVYTMNKYYGETEGPCLWEGKRCGLVTACGYEIEEGAGVFEEGLRRYSKHSNLEYIGKVAVRDIDGRSYFRSRSAVEGARQFARRVFRSMG